MRHPPPADWDLRLQQNKCPCWGGPPLSLLVADRAVGCADVLYLGDFHLLPGDPHLHGDLQLGGDLLRRGAAAGQLVHLVLQLQDALSDAMGGEARLWVVVPALHDGAADLCQAL